MSLYFKMYLRKQLEALTFRLASFRNIASDCNVTAAIALRIFKRFQNWRILVHLF